MPWLRSAKLSAEPWLSASSSTSAAIPLRRPIAIASASAAPISNSTMLFMSFATCPAPTPPQCSDVAREAAQQRLDAREGRGSAPTMTLSSPRSAACRVRATGASA